MIEPDDSTDPDERSIWSSKFDVEGKPKRRKGPPAPDVPKVPKTRIQSVLTALPVLMVLFAFGFYWHAERKQAQGQPIAAEQILLIGNFDRLTPSGEKQSGKHLLWLKVDGNSRSVRLTVSQKAALLDSELKEGDSVEVQAAPTVSESSVMWLMQLTHKKAELLLN